MTTRLWTCDHCGKRARWAKGWRWYPGVSSVANHEPGCMLPFAVCSDECEDGALARWVRREWATP